jgi:hypothetical protein
MRRLRSFVRLLLDATRRTRPVRNRNRWTRLALLVESGRAADTDCTFRTGTNVSAADASLFKGVAMANEYRSTTGPDSPSASARKFRDMREVAS